VRQSPALATHFDRSPSKTAEHRPAITPRPEAWPKSGITQSAEAYFVYPRMEVDDACGLTESLLSVELSPDSESKLIHVHEEPGPRNLYIPVSRRADFSRNTGPV
jgi:hypothetical protein